MIGLLTATNGVDCEKYNMSADSAFTPIMKVVPAFKKKKKNCILSNEKHNFNHHYSGVRVLVENCIGLLKKSLSKFEGVAALCLKQTGPNPCKCMDFGIHVPSSTISSIWVGLITISRTLRMKKPHKMTPHPIQMGLQFQWEKKGI
ncbi:uncharacterized protein VP01_6708g1 [Puccinia sorghi]|uniref:DDE Tnp4 domain-containing protein n=1 Tax=Puccinia sorghi TaxID=27349 RepID=A0A0L6UEX0_9BASI|nr:uncharacterized protein VP01_6708g1 [Puccinia sorghi]